MDKGIEKRQYERIFFSTDQHIKGLFSLAQDASEGFKISILNLSKGGMHFTQNRQGLHGLKEGDVIVLRGMSGQDPLNFTQDIQVKIKWILDTDFLEHVGYGGEFLNLTTDLQEIFSNVVTNGLPQSY